ncbi:hypothetical protein GCM10023144_02550 [Pigmentiphaga soli]|uniref:Cardiolipin synthase N-terminal domain-containing protein n=1 Tax=Pigmentiphaga soli TaxID=1007095 RepID=A0ABP8GDT7_9BURK
MPAQQITHLVIVGIVFVIAVTLFAVIMRKSGQRRWWVYLLLFLLAPLAGQVLMAMFR